MALAAPTCTDRHTHLLLSCLLLWRNGCNLLENCLLTTIFPMIFWVSTLHLKRFHCKLLQYTIVQSTNVYTECTIKYVSVYLCSYFGVLTTGMRRLASNLTFISSLQDYRKTKFDHFCICGWVTLPSNSHSNSVVASASSDRGFHIDIHNRKSLTVGCYSCVSCRFFTFSQTFTVKPSELSLSCSFLQSIMDVQTHVNGSYWTNLRSLICSSLWMCFCLMYALSRYF